MLLPIVLIQISYHPAARSGSQLIGRTRELFVLKYLRVVSGNIDDDWLHHVNCELCVEKNFAALRSGTKSVTENVAENR